MILNGVLNIQVCLVRKGTSAGNHLFGFDPRKWLRGCAAQVLDSLITSLTKHTSLLSPAIPQASIAFGADEMSCMATETMFELANRCSPLLLCSPALGWLHLLLTCPCRAPMLQCKSLLTRGSLTNCGVAQVGVESRPHSNVCIGSPFCFLWSFPAG